MDIRLLSITPSQRLSKKLTAVFLVGGTRHSVHFGAKGYMDYIRYFQRDPATAKKKRTQYIARHGAKENWQNPLTAASLARYILWALTVNIKLMEFYDSLGISMRLEFHKFLRLGISHGRKKLFCARARTMCRRTFYY